MVYLLLIGGFLVSLGATLLLTPSLRRLALRRKWVDHPHSEREIHTAPIPTIGGLAIVGGFAAGLLFFAGIQALVPLPFPLPSGPLLLGGALLAATGLYDDVRGVGFKRKFVIQLVVAYLMLWAGYRIDLSTLPFIELTPYEQALFSIPLTLIWIVGLINAINMIDGLDGLAAGVAGIAFVSLAVVFGINGDLGAILLAIALVGALIGFLVFNYNPASIFMGDTGSGSSAINRGAAGSPVAPPKFGQFRRSMTTKVPFLA